MACLGRGKSARQRYTVPRDGQTMKPKSVLLGLTLTVGLTGCAINSNMPHPDRILLVKSHAQAAEMKTAELVPRDVRADIRQADKGTLLRRRSAVVRQHQDPAEETDRR